MNTSQKLELAESLISQALDLVREAREEKAADDADVRTPMSSLYDWDTAPEWAQWAATDWDGYGFWYRHKPVQDPNPKLSLWHTADRLEVIGAPISLPGDGWKDSLEQRPK